MSPLLTKYIRTEQCCIADIRAEHNLKLRGAYMQLHTSRRIIIVSIAILLMIITMISIQRYAHSKAAAIMDIIVASGGAYGDMLIAKLYDDEVIEFTYGYLDESCNGDFDKIESMRKKEIHLPKSEFNEILQKANKICEDAIPSSLHLLSTGHLERVMYINIDGALIEQYFNVIPAFLVDEGKISAKELENDLFTKEFAEYLISISGIKVDLYGHHSLGLY